MRRLLFSKSKSELKSVADKYNVLVPEPLNTQFPDRIHKEEAVKRNAQKQTRESVTLFPAGEFITCNN